jgi:hypothetical protein
MLRRCLRALVLGVSAFLLPAQAWAGRPSLPWHNFQV